MKMRLSLILLILMATLFFSSCEKEVIVEKVVVEKVDVLPPIVNWISKLRISNDQVKVVWHAGDTITNAFELEKKVGDSDYQVIARLDGAAVNRLIDTYSFTDHNPDKYRITHYRLRSFSVDDTSKYINIPPLVIGETVKTGSYSNGRSESELVRIDNGEIVMLGGYMYNIIATTQNFIPSTGEWLEGTAMAQERKGHRAVLLKNGKILVTGGSFSDNHFTSTELYEPATNTFTKGADMNYTHTGHTITALKDGSVLVVAGYRSNAAFSNKCEIYYPDKNEWKEIAPLNVARAGHRTFQLRNGDILVIGGVTKDVEGYPISSCELYSFSTNNWKEVGSLLSVREGFAAFEVDESNILVAAGKLWNTDTQIELYNTNTFASSQQPNSLLKYYYTEAVDLGNGLVLLYGQVNFGFVQEHPLNLQVYDKSTKQWLLTNFLPFENGGRANGILLEPNKTLFTSTAGESLTFHLKLEK